MAAMLDAARHATPERRAELASLAASSGRFAVNAGNHDVARHLLQAALELSEHRGVERARRVADLLARMTVEEKCMQLRLASRIERLIREGSLF